MATAKKEISVIRKIKKNKAPELPPVPKESPYRPVYDILASAGETASAELFIPEVRKAWDWKWGKKTISSINVQVYGFPDLETSSKRIALAVGLGEKKTKNLLKSRPEIAPLFLEYFQYFGEILPVHLLHQRIFIAGFGSGVSALPTANPKEIRKFMETEYWGADEEEYPGNPVILLGMDGERNLWFGSDESNHVWTYDYSIQGVRNANYYDDDDYDYILWPEYVKRIIKGWLK
jgi:hypothetical protein